MSKWSYVSISKPEDLKKFEVELNRRASFLFKNIDAKQIISVLNDISGILSLAKGGTGISLTAPAADSIMFYDKSGNAVTWLDIGAGLSITGTTLSASLAAVLLGTTKQIAVTDNGDGTYILSTPQNIDTSADVEFDSIKLDDLTASRMVSADANKKIVSIADLTAWIAGTSYQITSTNDGDGTLTLSFPSVVRFGDLAGGNYTEIEADGTVKFVGNATVYDDLQFQVSNGKVPSVAHYPAWETFTPNTSEYSFAVDDYIDLSANELPHKWEIGTKADMHAHITTKAANTSGANQYAKFTIYVAYCDTDEVWQETSFTQELTIPTGTAALTLFYLDLGDLILTNYVLGAEIKVRLKRITATGGTEYPVNIFVTQIGAHYKGDTSGSRTETSK